jgi:hypothetical protein
MSKSETSGINVIGKIQSKFVASYDQVQLSILEEHISLLRSKMERDIENLNKEESNRQKAATTRQENKIIENFEKKLRIIKKDFEKDTKKIPKLCKGKQSDCASKFMNSFFRVLKVNDWVKYKIIAMDGICQKAYDLKLLESNVRVGSEYDSLESCDKAIEIFTECNMLKCNELNQFNDFCKRYNLNKEQKEYFLTTQAEVDKKKKEKKRKNLASDHLEINEIVGDSEFKKIPKYFGIVIEIVINKSNVSPKQIITIKRHENISKSKKEIVDETPAVDTVLKTPGKKNKKTLPTHDIVVMETKTKKNEKKLRENFSYEVVHCILSSLPRNYKNYDKKKKSEKENEQKNQQKKQDSGSESDQDEDSDKNENSDQEFSEKETAREDKLTINSNIKKSVASKYLQSIKLKSLNLVRKIPKVLPREEFDEGIVSNSSTMYSDEIEREDV